MTPFASKKSEGFESGIRGEQIYRLKIWVSESHTMIDTTALQMQTKNCRYIRLQSYTLFQPYWSHGEFIEATFGLFPNRKPGIHKPLNPLEKIICMRNEHFVEARMGVGLRGGQHGLSTNLSTVIVYKRKYPLEIQDLG